MAPWLRRFLLALGAVLVTCLGVVLLAGALYTPNIAIPAGFLWRHVDVDGTPLRVLSRGAGRDVLLIHGSPGSIEDWQLIQDELAASARVIAFDRSGHGFSGDVGDYSYERNAEQALRLIEVLGLHDVIVVGHSYGGVIALAMALRAPAKLAHVVVLDSATYRGARELTPLIYMIGLPLLGRGAIWLAPDELKESRIRRGLRREFRAHPPSEAFLAQHVRVWSTPKVLHAMARETLGATPELQKLSGSYPSIRVPVHILAQAEDPFRRSTAERLHRAISGSSLALLSGTGHFLQYEKAAEVLRALRALVSGERAVVR